MAKVSEFFRSDYFNASDLEPDESLILTVESIEEVEMAGMSFGRGARRRQTKPVLRFLEHEKGLVCGKVIATQLARSLDTDEMDDWKGKRIELYLIESDAAESGFALRARRAPQARAKRSPDPNPNPNPSNEGE